MKLIYKEKVGERKRIINIFGLKITYNPIIFSIIKKIIASGGGRSHQKIIVSLTSFPYRIPYIHLTIESLLNQTMRPNMVILQLSELEFPNKEKDLPKNLLKLRKFGLHIKWTKDNLKQYKKLIPTLLEYPDDIIITTDDDRIYDTNLIKLLWNSYIKEPQYIHCHRTTKMYLNEDGSFNAKAECSYDKASFANKLGGGGGCLYPPHSLYKDVTNKELFTSLATTNDDIWFWLMAVMNDVRIKVIENNISNPTEIKELRNGPCLWKVNDKGEKLFYKDLNRMFEHYKGLKEKVINDMFETNQ